MVWVWCGMVRLKKQKPLMANEMENEMSTAIVSKSAILRHYDTLWIVRWDRPTGKVWEVLRQTSTGPLRYGTFDHKVDALECFEQIVESEEDDE